MIGVFDSGVGGLTLVREMERELPDYQIVYFGDTARIPYGTKSRETVLEFAQQDAKFLVSKGAKIIVIACNTASSVASSSFEKTFGIPVFKVISPGVVKALAETKNNKIGVIGTTGTIKSRVHEKQLLQMNPDVQVFTKACPLIVSLVEEGWHKRSETKRIIRTYLRPLKLAHIDTLILACTHFPIVKDTISEIMGKRVALVDPAREVVHEIKNYLQQHPRIEKTIRKGENIYFASDVPNNFDLFAKLLFHKHIKVSKVNITL